MLDNWQTATALLAVLAGILYSDFQELGNQGHMAGFSLRAPVQDVNPNPPTGPPKVNSTCPAGQIIFAEGNTKFSQLDPNGGWGWQIGPIAQVNNTRLCNKYPLWAGAGPNYKTSPDKYVGYAEVCNYKSRDEGPGYVYVDVFSNLGFPILCNIAVYVGTKPVTEALNSTNPALYTCNISSSVRGRYYYLRNGDGSQCREKGPIDRVGFETQNSNDSSIYAVIYAEYCREGCDLHCSTENYYYGHGGYYGNYWNWQYDCNEDNEECEYGPPAKTTELANCSTTSSVSQTSTSSAVPYSVEVTQTSLAEQVLITFIETVFVESTSTVVTKTDIVANPTTGIFTLSTRTSITSCVCDITTCFTQDVPTIGNPIETTTLTTACTPSFSSSTALTTFFPTTTSFVKNVTTLSVVCPEDECVPECDLAPNRALCCRSTTTTVTKTVHPVTSTFTTTSTFINPTPVTQFNTTTRTPTTTVITTSTVLCPKPSPSPCIDLGLGGAFNVYTFQDYRGSSDVQGRLLVGGNAYLENGFSVGDQLNISPPCSQANFIVGGQINGWNTGRDYFGNIVVGKPSTLGPVFDQGCKLIVNPKFFDFTGANEQILKANKFACSLKPTIKSFTVTYGKLTMNFAGNLPYEVIEITDPNFFNGYVSFIESVNGLKPGAVLVFNIKATTASIISVNMEALKNIPVIFNFCGTTKLSIQSSAVRGWILAPQADVSGATGVIWGSVFVNSLAGPIQVNIGQFPICISEAPTRFLAVRLSDTKAPTPPKTGDASSIRETVGFFGTFWAAIISLFYQ